MDKTMKAIMDLELTEAASDPCMAKFLAKTGRFKGGKGERFDACVQGMTQCRKDVEDPEALCASIARGKGLARGQKREALGEAAGAALVDRMAQAMLDAPKLAPLAGRVMDDEQLEVWQGLLVEPLRALIAKALDVAGVDVAGGLLARAGREMKGVARGEME